MLPIIILSPKLVVKSKIILQLYKTKPFVPNVL